MVSSRRYLLLLHRCRFHAYVGLVVGTMAVTVMAIQPRFAAAADQPGPNSEPLSLRQALERAVQNNADLRRERIAIETADARLQSARGVFDVNLTGNLTFTRRTRPSLGVQDIQAGSTDQSNFDLGIARNLETGGALSLGLGATRSETNAPLTCGALSMTGEVCNVYDTRLNLSLTQPLLRGFGPAVALADVRRAAVQKDQSLLGRQLRASLVLRDVVNTYWNLAYATQDLAIRRSAVDLARDQLRITKAQIDVGRSAPVDAAAVERAIGERMQEVLLSEQELLFRTLELRRLFGAAMDGVDPLFAAADAPQANPGAVDVGAEMARAVAANPQLRQLQLGRKLSDIDLAVARSTLLPAVDFVGSAGVGGLKRDLDDSFAQTFDFEARNFSVGLRFALPVQNRIAGGQHRAAQAAAELSSLNAADYEKELRYQIRRLASGVQTAAKRIELAKATVGFAQQNLEAEKARFSVGRSTNNEVLRVQQEAKNAEIQVVRATVDLLVSQTSLRALTGDLLDDHGIKLEGAP